MDSVFNSWDIVESYTLNTTITINGVVENVHVITFDSNFTKVIIPDNSGVASYASIFKVDLTSTSEALISAVNRPPRIVAVNQTSSTINGLPAYSIATEKWTNGYTIEVGDTVVFEGATNNPPEDPVIGCGMSCASYGSTLIEYEKSFRQLHRDVARLALPMVTDCNYSTLNCTDWVQVFDFSDFGKITKAHAYAPWGRPLSGTYGDCSAATITIPQLTVNEYGTIQAINDLYYSVRALVKGRRQGQIYSTSLSDSLTVEPLEAVDSTGIKLLSTSSNDTFTTSSTISDGNSGLAIGESLTTDTYYYLYIIAKPGFESNSIFMLSDTSGLTPATASSKMPTGYTLLRQLVCVIRTYTNSGVKIISFHQQGNDVTYRDFTMNDTAVTTTANITKFLLNGRSDNAWTTISTNFLNYYPNSYSSIIKLWTFREGVYVASGTTPNIGTPGYWFALRRTGTSDIFYIDDYWSNLNTDKAEQRIITVPKMGNSIDLWTNYYRIISATEYTYVDLMVAGYVLDEAKFN